MQVCFRHVYLTYTLTCQGFFFSFVAFLSLVPLSFDGGLEIKTVQVHVEVEINCGRKINMHRFPNEDVIGKKSILFASCLYIIIYIKKHMSTYIHTCVCLFSLFL